MKKKFVNETHIEGILYDHKLEERVTGDTSKNPGMHYIKGKISIATDDRKTNIVDINYTYEPMTTGGSNGKEVKPNSKYEFLNNIINGTYKTFLASQNEAEAIKLRVDSAVGLNEWYSDQNGSLSEPELVSVKVNDGGFLHIINGKMTTPDDPKDRSNFKTDIFLTSAIRKEPDEEHNIPERMVLKGYVFSFRQEILPIEYMLYDPNGMDYFESLNISKNNPIFTQVSGEQLSTTSTNKVEIESAWGMPQIKETTTTRKEFVVTWARPDIYGFDESTIELDDVTNMQAKRELYLAETKSRYEDSKKKKSTGFATPNTAVTDTPIQKFKF